MRTITQISELVELIERLSEQKGMIYRGHACTTWRLRPTLFRRSFDVDTYSHLERFKKYIIGKVDNIDRYGRMDYWALGQHHGLHTPLLDWTIAPGVAVFFALYDKKNSLSQHSALYCLNAQAINKMYCQKIYAQSLQYFPKLKPSEPESETEDYQANTGRLLLDLTDCDIKNKIVDSVDSHYMHSFTPGKYCSTRIIHQRGVFTYSPEKLGVGRSLAMLGRKDLLEKYVIDSSLRSKALKFLDGMNINSMTIYPDIAGVSEYTNSKISLLDPLSQKPKDAIYWLNE